MKKWILFGCFFFAYHLYAQSIKDSVGYSYTWGLQDETHLHNETRQRKLNREVDIARMQFLGSLFEQLVYQDGYTDVKVRNILEEILMSDDVSLLKTRGRIYDIQYGNLQDAGLGIEQVQVYHHVFIDIQQRKILPRFQVSFTY
jgi:hypothetical protein